MIHASSDAAAGDSDPDVVSAAGADVSADAAAEVVSGLLISFMHNTVSKTITATAAVRTNSESFSEFTPAPHTDVHCQILLCVICFANEPKGLP